MTRHRRRAVENVLNELLYARCARGPDRRGDTAAGRGDLLVGLALQTPVEFRLAIAGPRQMRVRVDEARDRRRSARIVILGDVQTGAPLRTDIGDATGADDD